MLIRTKLLLLGLATLALPWAGCQYAREMEGSLRNAESAALLAVAQTIATSLQGRRDLLFRDADGEGSRAPVGPDDLEPVPLLSDPQLDGMDDDWPRVERAWRRFGALNVLSGTHARYLFLLLEVRGRPLILDTSDGAALAADALGDRIWLGFTTPDGARDQVFLSGWSTGAIRGRRVASADLGRPETTEEPRISGAWRRRANGWVAEIRIPLSMIGDRLGVLVDDRDRRGATPLSLGSLSTQDLAPRGRLLAAAPELGTYLARFRQPGVRIAVTNTTGAILAEADALPASVELSGAQALLSRVYRRFLERSTLAQRRVETERGRIDRIQAEQAGAGQSGTALLSTTDERRLVVAAAAPIRELSSERVLGVLQVAQTADRWLLLRDRALTRLLNLTLLTTGLVLAAIAIFGGRLALRLERLRRASDAALTREGRVLSEFPEVGARDELGDLARGFAQLLGRLDDYTRYLRTLAGKLSHEIRTPLTIVRSSLENLESETLPATAAAYVARAREGSARLGSILQAMSAATHVEEAIRSAEFVRFDLAALLRSAVAAYATGFPSRGFALEGGDAATECQGAPDLIMQLLDKLIDNAVDFSPVGSTIVVRLRADGGAEPARAVIDVENEGPPLPPDAGPRLFESLWQRRQEHGGAPHFGLGLYIVKLIATQHGGSVEARNRSAGGVRFSVALLRHSSIP